MRLNEVYETGFYKIAGDEKLNYIFEVIENTDEEWLKDAPEHKFLIDEWIFDYIDSDDRAHYGTAGNLVSVQNAETFKVEKITDKDFKISGKCGEYLIEDKPTYKELSEKYKEALQEINRILREGRTFYEGCFDVPDESLSRTDRAIKVIWKLGEL